MADSIVCSPCTWVTVSDIINNRNNYSGKNMFFPVLAAPPSSPVEGQVYYDSVLDKPRVYDGTQWVDVGSGGSGSSVPLFPVLAIAPASPSTGQAFFDSTLGHIRVWDGSSWIDASGGATGTVDWSDLINRPPLYYTGAFTDSTNIVINHNMKKYPSVRVVDTGGTEWHSPKSITFTDLDNIVVKFNYLFAGTIYLS